MPSGSRSSPTSYKRWRIFFHPSSSCEGNAQADRTFSAHGNPRRSYPDGKVMCPNTQVSPSKSLTSAPSSTNTAGAVVSPAGRKEDILLVGWLPAFLVAGLFYPNHVDAKVSK